MFEALQWQWDYEPDLQCGYVIPDFVLSDFAHAIVVECKPSLTVDELAEQRSNLIARMPRWLSDDVAREIRELEGDGEATELWRQALQDLGRVRCGRNPLGRSRRVLVVGPVLHMLDERVTVDGEHGFCVCCDHGEPTHIGLAVNLGEPCLKCGEDATTWAASTVMLTAWRESQNVAQWKA